jgi:hypothetical protein
MIKSATEGILASSGIAGIDLIDDIISWVPVDTPFFNSVARGQGRGATAVFFESLVNVNNQQPDGGVQSDYAAPIALIKPQYTYSPYAVVGMGGTVSWDAIAQGLDFTDVLAVDTLQTINQLLIALEIHQLNAQSFALPAAPTPSVTALNSGGSLGASTAYYVKVAARSGVNWYRGGSQAVGSSGTATTSAGSTNSLAVSCSAVTGAAGYDWYVSNTAGGAGIYYYYTTTPVNTVTVTSFTAAAATVPTGYAGLYNAGQAGPASVPTVDSSFQSFWQNGLTASILGDWSAQPDQALVSGSIANLVTPGSGVSQEAYYQTLNGAQLAVSGAALEQVDEMNKAIYDTYQVTPSRLLMGSQTIQDISNSVLNNPQAVTFIPFEDRVARGNGVAGGHVATYLNKVANGEPIPLHLMPYLPPGKIVAVIDSLPFPGSNVTSALQARTQYDFFRFDYGANRQANTDNGGPRYDFEFRSRQAFVNRAAPICGVIENIGEGIA